MIYHEVILIYVENTVTYRHFRIISCTNTILNHQLILLLQSEVSIYDLLLLNNDDISSHY